MNTPVKTRLIKIGNSQGIRLPKTLIEQAGLTGEIEIEVQDGQLLIRPSHSPRQHWEAAFKAMACVGEDALLDGDTLPATEWEATEWQW